ncbi:hypothetical protein HDU82_005083 [Entophlyctis luteolus]|nr:hypothetical protein HDU82_005083 [Entophlyctis luteolus]
MLAVFGATDDPSSTDPIATAKAVADFVVANSLDGVDVDFEDSNAFVSGTAESWLEEFTLELRSRLPAGQYLISHAPQAPYFSKSFYPNGAFNRIDSTVGSLIDFYNVQFYNQGVGLYANCTSLLYQSGASPPVTGTSLFEIAKTVPINKLVMGKPYGVNDADNGYMTPASLAECVTLARNNGWSAGVATWHSQGLNDTVLAWAAAVY